MTDTLREIEKGHEAKYKQDEESRFKAQCRRAKLFGLWAAEKMGMTEAQAGDYAKGLIRMEIEQPASDAVIHKVLADFRQSDVSLTEYEAIAEFDRCLAVALEQLAGEFPTALDKDHVRVGD